MKHNGAGDEESAYSTFASVWDVPFSNTKKEFVSTQTAILLLAS